tara:strand:+ start:4112 stop:4720 length:609 start_codon:yes stop_codon:yes gene_type:complete
MMNLSFRYNQNSSSLELMGMPDVSNGDSVQTLGILSSWTLKIIGSPLLEGEKHHLDNLMQAVLEYSRLYISGIRKPFKSKTDIVSISPFGLNHKLLLKSSKKNVEPLEIILDDSELSDLTRCLDLLRFDPRINIKWSFELEKPFSKQYILRNLRTSNMHFNFFFAILIFLITSSLLYLIPIDNKKQIIESNSKSPQTSIEIK